MRRVDLGTDSDEVRTERRFNKTLIPNRSGYNQLIVRIASNWKFDYRVIVFIHIQINVIALCSAKRIFGCILCANSFRVIESERYTRDGGRCALAKCKCIKKV